MSGIEKPKPPALSADEEKLIRELWPIVEKQVHVERTKGIAAPQTHEKARPLTEDEQKLVRGLWPIVEEQMRAEGVRKGAPSPRANRELQRRTSSLRRAIDAVKAKRGERAAQKAASADKRAAQRKSAQAEQERALRNFDVKGRAYAAATEAAAVVARENAERKAKEGEEAEKKRHEGLKAYIQELRERGLLAKEPTADAARVAQAAETKSESAKGPPPLISPEEAMRRYEAEQAKKAERDRFYNREPASPPTTTWDDATMPPDSARAPATHPDTIPVPGQYTLDQKERLREREAEVDRTINGVGASEEDKSARTRERATVDPTSEKEEVTKGTAPQDREVTKEIASSHEPPSELEQSVRRVEGLTDEAGELMAASEAQRRAEGRRRIPPEVPYDRDYRPRLSNPLSYWLDFRARRWGDDDPLEEQLQRKFWRIAYWEHNPRFNSDIRKDAAALALGEEAKRRGWRGIRIMDDEEWKYVIERAEEIEKDLIENKKRYDAMNWWQRRMTDVNRFMNWPPSGIQ